jgi:hypothetical protein
MLTDRRPARRRKGFAGILALFLSAFAPPTAAQDLILRDVRILDVEEAALSVNRDVAVTDGRVSAIAPELDATAPVEIDGAGRVLAPGLWDSHVHVFTSPDEPDAALPLYLVNGITVIRDMGALWPIGDMQALARAIEEGTRPGPRVILSGAWVDGSPGSWPGMFLADTPDEARAIVDRIASEGWAAVKSYSMLLPEVHAALAEAAAEHGLPLVGHVPEAVTLGAAIDAGQAGLEHWGRVTQACATREDALVRGMEDALRRGDDQPALLARLATHNGIVLESWDEMRCRDVVVRMARAGVHVSPTHVVADFYLGVRPGPETPRMQMLPDPVREAWAGPDFRLDAMTEEVRTRADASLALDARVFEMAHDAGVPILASTDASFANPWIFHGFSLHDELRRYTERGLSTREALATATVAPRRFLLGESGRIEPGTRADLLLLQGDPLQDLNLLQDPDAVIVAGHVHDRASLEAMRDALRSR